MYRVVTDLGILGFNDASREMHALSLHPGVSGTQVQENTGFDLGINGELPVTDVPDEGELEVLRELDPERLYTA